MRKCLRIVLGCLVFVVGVALAGSSHAAFISLDDAVFGSGALTLDTETDLQWLDITETQGLIYDSLAADLQNQSSPYDGFRIATAVEFMDMIGNFGFTTSESAPSTLHGSFFDLFGSTSLQGAYRELFGYTTDRDASGMVGVYGFDFYWMNGAPVYELYDGSSLRHGACYSFPTSGTFLVRAASDAAAVPEPGTLLLLGAGLLPVALLRRKSRG